MKCLLFINIFLSLWNFFNRTEIINRQLEEAQKAFRNKQYHRSVEIYDSLVTYQNYRTEKVMYNMAQAYFYSGDTSNCKRLYRAITKGSNPSLKSSANQQLGNLAWKNGNKKLSIQYFTQALKADPTNHVARINLELAQKILKREDEFKSKLQTQASKSKTKDKNNQDTSEGQGQQSGNGKSREENFVANGTGSSPSGLKVSNNGKSGRGESSEKTRNELSRDDNGNKDNQSLSANKLNAAHISEQRAKMILEAMKNSEVQYPQQRKRKVIKDSNLPDW